MKGYTFIKDFRDNENYRKSFNNLAINIFGINFEEWKKQGYWTNKYIPYAFFDKDKIAANVSANIIDLNFNGKKKKAIQIGTVMTDKNYRGQALSRKLIESIFEDYKNDCDFFYLFANKTVLNFYPKFGFRRTWEYQTIADFEKKQSNITVKKINMDNFSERDMFINLVKNTVIFSKISMIDNLGLIMFYCGLFMKDDIYYIPELNIAAVAEYSENTICIYDIFSKNEFDLNAVVNALLTHDKMKVVFGFTPAKNENFNSILKENDDDALFIKDNSNDSEFNLDKEMFPVLSHA